MEHTNQGLSDSVSSQNFKQTASENPQEQSPSPTPDTKRGEAMAQPPQLPFFQKHKKWIAVLIAIFLFVALGLGLYFDLVTQKQETASSDRQIPKKTTITPSLTPASALSSFPSPTPYQEEVECYENDKYFIVDESGAPSGFLVKYKANSSQQIRCSYTVGESDYVIEKEWAVYYLGLTGDFLLLDQGTGPGIRGLIIYDLSKREKVFTDGYESYPVQSAVIIQQDSLIYWTGTDIEATPQNCPEFEKWSSGGLGAVVETKVKLDLSTLTKAELGEHQCMPVQ